MLRVGDKPIPAELSRFNQFRSLLMKLLYGGAVLSTESFCPSLPSGRLKQMSEPDLCWEESGGRKVLSIGLEAWWVMEEEGEMEDERSWCMAAGFSLLGLEPY